MNRYSDVVWRPKVVPIPEDLSMKHANGRSKARPVPMSGVPAAAAPASDVPLVSDVRTNKVPVNHEEVDDDIIPGRAVSVCSMHEGGGESCESSGSTSTCLPTTATDCASPDDESDPAPIRNKDRCRCRTRCRTLLRRLAPQLRGHESTHPADAPDDPSSLCPSRSFPQAQCTAPPHYMAAPWPQIPWIVPLMPVPVLGDLGILNSLSASPAVMKQLLEVASVLQDSLQKALGRDHVLLYGSLAMSREEMPGIEKLAQLHSNPARPVMKQIKTFATNKSDADFAILVESGASALEFMHHFADDRGWTGSPPVGVAKFGAMQKRFFTQKGIQVDFTCYTGKVNFHRFRERQREFLRAFSSLRNQIEGTFSFMGVVAFDAYIFQLKDFATRLLPGATASHQAVCLGLFVLNHLLRRGSHQIMPHAPWFFNNFLCFCTAFFGTASRPDNLRRPLFKACSLELGGRCRVRNIPEGRPQLYFFRAEENCGTPKDDWMNVLHNINPTAIAMAAEVALQGWHGSREMSSDWRKWLVKDMDGMSRITTTPRGE